MRKAIGIGETIYDIIFKDNQPIRGVPGGSAFNSMISLGRLGVQTNFISEVGRDKIGDLILSFMQDNGVDTHYMYRFHEGKSPISLAFLNEHSEAEYDFYMNYPKDRLEVVWPRINQDDVLLFGSFFSLNAQLRPALLDLLNFAKERKAILLYDPNLRKNHAQQALWMMPSIIENLEFADVVRGSADDFFNIYKERDVAKIYTNHIKYYCKIFICTDADKGVFIKTPKVDKFYPAKRIEAISTIGAGDSFNAGLIFAFMKYGITGEMLLELEESTWDSIIAIASDCASEVCLSFDNYISIEFAAELKRK